MQQPFYLPPTRYTSENLSLVAITEGCISLVLVLLLRLTNYFGYSVFGFDLGLLMVYLHKQDIISKHDEFNQTFFLFPIFRYESNENMTITCSTKVCSFGKQVVEKVETEYARFEGGRFVYRIHRSPMCEYMVNFIHKLKHLPEKYMMNSVLENFTILQVRM